MSISRFLVFFCLCWLWCGIVSAQGSYQFGLMPAINFNHKFENGWSFNIKTESRQLIESGAFNGDRDSGFDYILTDNSVIVSKKVGLNSRISGGYLIRFREGTTFHRFIQQYTITQRLQGFRLSHRVVTDQTLSASHPTTYRLRYRLAAELPLNGTSADVKEFYLKISNEYLNSLERSDYDLEIRLVPLLGYTVSEKHKVEAGLDYRVNSFLNDPAGHSFWTRINWFIEL